MITPIFIGTSLLLLVLGAKLFFCLQSSIASGLAGEPSAVPDASKQQRPGGDSPTPPTIFRGIPHSSSGRCESSVRERTANPNETDGSILDAAPSGMPSMERKIICLLNPNILRRV
jgi:hypothetical protein